METEESLVLKAYKLKNGEEVVAFALKEGDQVSLKQPMMLIRNISEKIRDNYFLLVPWTTMQKDTDVVNIFRDDIVTSYEVDDTLKASHKSLWFAFWTTTNAKRIVDEDDQQIETFTKTKKNLTYVQVPRVWSN